MDVMIGGTVIEIKEAVLVTEDGNEIPVFRLWVMQNTAQAPVGTAFNECCVHIERTTLGYPRLGHKVWWQNGRLFFVIDERKFSLAKIGPSFTPSRELARSVA